MSLRAEFEARRQELLELEKKLKRNEDEALALLEVLNSPGPDGSAPVGLTGNLVDEEGFPRADIDIPTIRKHRHRLAILKTDRKALERDIEEKLHELHEAQRNLPDDEEDEDQKESTRNESQARTALVEPATRVHLGSESGLGDDLVPLALVNQVFDGSPAQEAGLEEGDRIVQFGVVQYVAGSSYSKPDLGAFAAEASSHFEQPISVRALRGETVVELELTPRRWGGQGVLGCHIIPI